MHKININCDVGEGINNEALLMPYISSCNIACGAHAGDVETIDRVIQLAQEHQVKIGAHPSFPDRENFGREVMDISLSALEQSLVDQIQLLQERISKAGAELTHVKAHGALYNLSVKDQAIARVIVDAVKKVVPAAILYVPYPSEIEKIALENQLCIRYEGFADRNYNGDLSLVSRKQNNAILTDKEAVIQHISEMILHQQVKTVNGTFVPIKVDTLCVHGDNTEAIELVQYIYESLAQKGISIV